PSRGWPHRPRPAHSAEVRRGALRHQNAAHGRPGSAGARPHAGPRRGVYHAFGPRQHRAGGGSHQKRRLRLPAQAARPQPPA
nr:hypothetical protein [Tanacetum cinerariifolium]